MMSLMTNFREDEVCMNKGNMNEFSNPYIAQKSRINNQGNQQVLENTDFVQENKSQPDTNGQSNVNNKQSESSQNYYGDSFQQNVNSDSSQNVNNGCLPNDNPNVNYGYSPNGAPNANYGYSPNGAPNANYGYSPNGAPNANYGYSPNGAPNANYGYSPNGAPNANYGYSPNYKNPQTPPYNGMPNNGFTSVVKKVFDKVDRLFAVFAVILGFLSIQLIVSVWFEFGIGASIFFLASLAVSYIYVRKKGIKVDLLHNIMFGVLALFSLSFTFYSNRLVLAMDFMFLILGLFYWIYSTGGKERRRHGSRFNELFLSLFYNPFVNYGSMFSALFKREKGQKNGNAKWIISGLCIAVPLVAIVSSLLLMGDEMFRAMFSFVFDNFISKLLKYIWFAIVGLPVAMAIFSSWYTKYGSEKELRNNYNTYHSMSMSEGCHIAPPVLMYSIAIPLCVVYFLYLLSQLAYFVSFIAENLLPKNYTIVDYARNGFFELCVVTAINIVIISLLLLLTKRVNGVMPTGLRVISIMMSAFTMVFIFTALAKMFMYINKYGYTSLRINTSVFMAFLLVVFILIIVKQIFKKVNFFAFLVAFSMIFLAGYNLIDVDALIARENIKLYQQGQIEWMGNELVISLDDSAFEYIAPFAKDKNNGLSEIEQKRLDYYLQWVYNDYSDEIATFNVNKYRVHKILEENGYGEYTSFYEY